MTARIALITLSIAGVFFAPRGVAQSAAGPKFEVASIKPCKSGDVVPLAGVKGGRAGSGRVTSSPGRLNVECRTVASLIRDAYLSYPSGEVWPQPAGSLTSVPPLSDRIRGQEIKGSPAWVNDDR